MFIADEDEELMGMYHSTNTLKIIFAFAYKHILTIGPRSAVCLLKRNEESREKKMPVRLLLLDDFKQLYS